jgi:hypothetical protein
MKGGAAMENTVYSMIQPKGNVYILPVIIIIFLLVLMVAMVGTLISIKRTAISIGAGEIVIDSFPYGRKIPAENILAHEVKAVNLNETKEYDIAVRLNGIGLPNFYSGWMKLNNGKKALTFITDKNSVLLMPTKDYVVLFTMDKIEEFISGLKERR